MYFIPSQMISNMNIVLKYLKYMNIVLKYLRDFAIKDIKMYNLMEI